MLEILNSQGFGEHITDTYCNEYVILWTLCVFLDNIVSRLSLVIHVVTRIVSMEDILHN